MSYFGKDFDYGFNILMGLALLGAITCILSALATLGWIIGLLFGAWTT